MEPTDTPARRQLLRAGGGLWVVAVAGCAGGADGDTTPSASPTTERTTVELSAQTMEALDQYSAAAEQFEAQVDRLASDADGRDVRTDELYDRLEYGTRTLEEARTDATADRREVIDAFLGIGAWLRELTDALAAYRRGMDAFADGESHHSDGRYADAVERFDAASSRFQDGIRTMEAASTTYDRIDLSPLGRVDGVDRHEIRSDLAAFRDSAAELGPYLRGMDRLARAARDYADGRRRYEAGATAADDGDYRRSTDEFEAARDAFDAAGRTASESGGPDGLSDGFGALACAAGAYGNASDHMLTAISEVEAGDEGAAEEAYEAALSAEATAEECL